MELTYYGLVELFVMDQAVLMCTRHLSNKRTYRKIFFLYKEVSFQAQDIESLLIALFNRLSLPKGNPNKA